MNVRRTIAVKTLSTRRIPQQLLKLQLKPEHLTVIKKTAEKTGASGVSLKLEKEYRPFSEYLEKCKTIGDVLKVTENGMYESEHWINRWENDITKFEKEIDDERRTGGEPALGAVCRYAFGRLRSAKEGRSESIKDFYRLSEFRKKLTNHFQKVNVVTDFWAAYGISGKPPWQSRLFKALEAKGNLGKPVSRR